MASFSRPTLGPNFPPIQLVPEALSPGIKRLLGELNHKTRYSGQVKIN